MRVILLASGMVGVVPCGVSCGLVGRKVVGGWCDGSGAHTGVLVKDESSVNLTGSRVVHVLKWNKMYSPRTLN